MKRIYIAGPLTQGILADNVNAATAAFIALAKAGHAPWCPAWSVYAKECQGTIKRVVGEGGQIRRPVSYVDAGEVVCYGTVEGHPDMTHDAWLAIDLAWVAVADGVLRLPGFSVGADMETNHARTLGIPVYHSIEEIPR